MKRLMLVGASSPIVFVLTLLLFILGLQPTGYGQKKGKKGKGRIEVRSLSDTLVPVLANKISSYSFTLDRDSFQLEKGFDLATIDTQITGFENRTKSFHSIFSKFGQTMNIRGLNTSVIMLRDVSSQLKDAQAGLEQYSKTIKDQKEEVEKILRDTFFSIVVNDSDLMIQMRNVEREAQRLYGRQALLQAKINLLNSRASVCQFQTGELISDMIFLTINQKTNLFKPDHRPILESQHETYRQSTWTNLKTALTVSGRVISIYSGTRLCIFVWLALGVFVVWGWLKFNIRQVKKKKNVEKIMESLRFLEKNLFLTSLLFFLTLTPLVFSDPPAALFHLVSLFQMIILIVMVYRFFTPRFKKWVASFVVIWVCFILDDLLLNDSNGERWLLFVCGLGCLAYFAFLLWKDVRIFKNIPNPKLQKPLLIFGLSLSFLNVLFNVIGCFSLAKIMGVTAVQSLFLALVLEVLCVLAMRIAYLQSEAAENSRTAEFFKFDRVKKKILKTLLVLAGIVWLIGLIRNLTLYSWFSGLFFEFLDDKRMIGKYDFTFSSVFIFIIIIWFSSFLSKIINYFFGYEKVIKTGKRSRLNSMVLIFRLCIWVVGFLIAIAAAGIPLDKISIMLGALGVGIGFGLQNIVNNLVSGIILAFERPVQVGDHIEVGGKSGMIKEIGVRASKINNWEGADIIIPNGDLLSQQVTNWTIQNRNKRALFRLRVPYKTDLVRMRELVTNFIQKQKGVLQKPPLAFNVKEFNAYYIEIEIYFWTPELSNLDSVRSDVMIGVKHLLTQEGIDLHPPLPPVNSADGGGLK